MAMNHERALTMTLVVIFHNGKAAGLFGVLTSVGGNALQVTRVT